MIAAGGPRSVTLLLSAIGGEGGGVLSGWIVEAARRHGLPVQSTSIPGVAQRTGATTYYMEIFPVPAAELAGREPVLAIYPAIGDVDVMVASEFAEAGRAIMNGFVTPDRTVLIASTHRVYAIGERGHMGDGRFDSEALFEAASVRSKRALLGDLRQVARDHGVSLNAVLLGVIAASGLLPVPRSAFEDAIRTSAIAVDANLRGFAVGHDYRFADQPARAAPDSAAKRWHRTRAEELERQIDDAFAEAAREVLREGVRRLCHYQDAAYAGLYLERTAAVRDAADGAEGGDLLVREAARHLAIRMSYEDVIRVAQLKTDPGRMARIRAEVRATEDEPVVVIDYFKPGIDELCAILPAGAGGWLAGVAERRGWRDHAWPGMRIRTTTVWGFLRLRVLAGLRRLRHGTYGYREAQRAIDEWLEDVCRAAGSDVALAREIAECARLVKGYGETHARGRANLARIREALIQPALAGELPPSRAVDAIANARAASLADPDGGRLSEMLDAIRETGLTQAAE